jgi:DNA polymerase I-like protein with 3'-5' exonuclease and polymerase domains
MKGLQKEAGRDDVHVLLQASNAPIQGTSADVLKAALIQLHNKLAGPPYCCRLMLTVSTAWHLLSQAVKRHHDAHRRHTGSCSVLHRRCQRSPIIEPPHFSLWASLVFCSIHAPLSCLVLRCALQTHDDVLLEVPTHYWPELKSVVEATMQDVLPQHRLMLRADVAAGASWLDCKT